MENVPLTSSEERRAMMQAHIDSVKDAVERPDESTEPERCCLTYWFPKLRDAGLPVPRTEIVDAGPYWRRLMGLLDGPRQENGKAVELADTLCAAIHAASARVGGYPLFLRTGQGSGKHRWKDCCFVTNPDALPSHIGSLVEWSETVDFFGLSFRYWAVRELLPTKPIAVLPAYGNMPLVREIRAFVRGGKVVCCHPYWPADSIREGFGMRNEAEWDGLSLDAPKGPKEWRAGRHPIPANLNEIILAGATLPKYLGQWSDLLDRVAALFADDGAWSVDVLETERGWYVTDMAEAARSFHWPHCDKAAGVVS